MKTGGGTAREGLGRGIHWHIENDVRYFATDAHDQEIPYVVVFNEDGTTTEYVDTESGLVPETVDPSYLRQMECTTCHNRITHLISQPVDTVDQLMSRGAISPDIPAIRRKAVDVYHLDYADLDAAQDGIAELAEYYEANHPEFYSENAQVVAAAIVALQDAYLASVFPEQKADWTSHPDNVGHKDSPGCFRCHDGKHLNTSQEAIRLECNLCHSIPVVAGPTDFVASIEISRGPEPSSHLNPNWIGLHRDVFDPSCSNCHSTDDPGGTSNTSFCSNSACHGIAWVYAGFDAPSLREILRAQLDLVASDPEPELEDLPLSYEGAIGPLLEARCGACHAEGGLLGLNVTTFDTLMQGGTSGLAIIPGDPKGSLLVQRQSGDEAHFGQLSAEELALVVEWITTGAPE
jgi:mono/diheme cytochrome c family protein